MERLVSGAFSLAPAGPKQSAPRAASAAALVKPAATMPARDLASIAAEALDEDDELE